MTPVVASDPIQSRRRGTIVELCIDRPAVRNALDDESLSLLADLLGEADADPDTRCIVIAGSATVFASGADIRALQELTVMQVYGGTRSTFWDRIRAVRTPMVAAVSGLCLGGGLELALMCDVVVAAAGTRFGLPETQLGLIPGAGGTQYLPRMIGRWVASDMMLTGRLLTTEEAGALGLVSRVAPADDWLEVAASVADDIAVRPPVAQRLVKHLIRQAEEHPFSGALAAERSAFGLAFGSDDPREGLDAFLFKRVPEWRHQ